MQSTVMALLAAKTDAIPTVDAAVFSDTGDEHPHTYEHLDWLETEIDEFPIYRASIGRRLSDDVLEGVNESGYGMERYGYRYHSIPLFSESGGMTRRTCTAKYKIRPLEKTIREQVLGLSRGKRAPRGVLVEQWLGITAEEAHRMRDSSPPWARTEWPLISVLGWTREDCLSWFAEAYPNRALAKSACTFCPYQSAASWMRLRDEQPEEWARAVEMDRKISQGPVKQNNPNRKVVLYLHPRGVPLEQALSLDPDMGKSPNGENGDLWGNECFGVCHT